MKKLIILLFSFSALSGIAAIVPEQVITPNLDLFSSWNKTFPNGDVEVQVSLFTKRGELQQNRDKKILSKKQYEDFLKPSLAVFQTDPKETPDNPQRLRGTAFNIGNNLVLTNHHVLDESFRNTTHCDGFRVRDHDNELYNCKKIHYCNAAEDICLIEMQPIEKVKRSCLFCRGTKYEVSLAEKPVLKLKDNYELDSHTASEEIFTAIGNSAGLGIHLSQGRGILIYSDYMRFWAPITSGNSGGPLLNSEGLVVGVVKHQTELAYGTSTDLVFNGAAPIKREIALIREALAHDPETLLKFNQSVVE